MDIGKIEGKNCYKMINFSLMERLTSTKVEKILWLQRNDKKVTLLLIYHIPGF